jgi:hypothetical protein
MASLTGNLISSTYQSILKIGTNNTASANLNNVTDGAGNATGLYVSTATTAVSGSFTVTGSMIVSGTLAATSSNAISASYAVSSSLAVSASNANFLDGLDSTAFVLKSGSNVMTGSIILDGQLSFNNGQGTLVLPANTAPIPTVGSTYYNGSTLYVYNGSQYIQIGGDTVISASFAVSASRATSAANATTASFVTTAQTASYVLNAVSASRATSALSASYSVSASYAQSANNAITASFATIAYSAAYLTSEDGTVVVSSSIVPVTTNTYTLGSQLNYWKDIFVSTGSIYFVNDNNEIVSTLSATPTGASLGDSLTSTNTGVQMQKLVPAGTIQAWTVGNSMNIARYAAVGVGTQTTALVAGGSGPSNNGQRTHYNTSEEYSGSIWTTSANLPSTASFAAGAGTQTAALVYGGQRASFNAGMVNTYAYDGSTWSSRNNMIVDQFQAGGFGTQNAAISFGGYSSSSLNSNSRYTQTYDGTSWSTATPLESSTQAPAGVGNLDAGLAIGGFYFGNLTTVQEWTVNIWSQGSNLNTGRSAAGAAGTYTSAVVFGGAVDGSGPSSVPTDVTEYWNGTTWSTGTPLIFGTIYPGAAGSSNTAAIGFGGSGPDTLNGAIANTQIYSEVQQYDTVTTFNYSSTTGTITATGSLLGTASFATNAVSASRATSALTSSHAVRAYNAEYLSSPDGTVAASSSIVPVTTNTYTLGSALNYWKDIYVSTGSIYFVNANNAIVSTLSATPTGATLGQSLSSTDTGVQMQKLVPAGTIQAWTVGNSMSVPRRNLTGVGTETAALAVGGQETGNASIKYNLVEEYNGTSWSTAANLPRTASNAMGAGTQEAALIFGGRNWNFATGVTTTNAYDGTAWSSRANMVTGQYIGASFGTQEAAIAAGGLFQPPGMPNTVSNLGQVQVYDGTTWSIHRNPMAQFGEGMVGVGNFDNGLVIGGYFIGDFLTTVQEWFNDGFDITSNLNVGRFSPGAAGTATSAVVFGGEYRPDPYAAEYATLSSTEYWDGIAWSMGNNLVFATTLVGSAGSSNTAALGFGGEGPVVEGSIANTQIYGSVQLYDTETSFDFDSSTGNLAIEGAVSINNVLTLQPFQTLPSAALNPNSFAVSGSKPYFSDGVSWFSLY